MGGGQRPGKRKTEGQKEGSELGQGPEVPRPGVQVVGLVSRVLPKALLGKWVGLLELRVRERMLSVPVVLELCLLIHLDPAGSLRKAMDFLGVQGGEVGEHPDGSALCQARKRLPVRLFQLAARHVGVLAARTTERLYGGWRVGMVDGSSSALQATEPNRRAFGRAENQHARSRYPVLRWAVLVGGAAKSVVDAAFGPYGVSEVRLVEQILERLEAGWLVLGDALTCSWRNLATAQGRGSHLLVRRHVARKGKRYRGRRIRERWEVWRRPRLTGARRAHQLATLPESLVVRIISVATVRKGWRAERVELCTTLQDPEAYPAEELAALYLERWEVELVLRHLKGQYGLDWLRNKSPKAVAQELYTGFLAYNLVCLTMGESSADPAELSPERARTLVLSAMQGMAWAPRRSHATIYRKLLVRVARAELRRQPRGPEPRLLARDPRRGWQMLHVTRSQWKAHNVVA